MRKLEVCLAAVALACLSLFASVCIAESPPSHPVDAVAEVISVYDGDTLTVHIVGWPRLVGENMPVRIAGIDTPELRDPRPDIRALAVKARDHVAAICPSSAVAHLSNVRRGKYFRLVADVECEGVDVGSTLLELELAKPYDGGKKAEW